MVEEITAEASDEGEETAAEADDSAEGEETTKE